MVVLSGNYDTYTKCTRMSSLPMTKLRYCLVYVRVQHFLLVLNDDHMVRISQLYLNG